MKEFLIKIYEKIYRFMLKISYSRIKVFLAEATVFQGDHTMLYLPIEENIKKIKIYSKLSVDDVKFYNYKEYNVAFLPINYSIEPGKYLIEVKIFFEKDILVKKIISINVKEKEFSKDEINVSKNMMDLREKNNFDEDQKIVSLARNCSSKSPYWNGTFMIPVNGKISSEYGDCRLINGKEESRHSGIDISAERGTKIFAANRGKVVLARNLNLTGNTIVIDHGMNLFSSYSHLDLINVKIDTVVEKGSEIGRIGNTGFSTAPHLHFTFTIKNSYINPWKIFAYNPISIYNAKLIKK